MRIVSLVPSVTDTLLSWGVEPVAVTRFCEQGSRFPTIGGTKDPNISDIIARQPDLVVMCDQENNAPDAEALREAGVPVHHIHITALAHVAPEMRRLAAAVGLPVTVADNCVAEHSSRPRERMRAYIPIWKRPWMTLNEQTYATSLLSELGLDSIAAGIEDRYPEVDLEEAAVHKPDLVIAPSEPYVFGERNRAELETVAPVLFVDGKDLFWWGTRTPEAVTRLEELLAEFASASALPSQP